LEKTPKDTNAFLERKIKIVGKNSEKITKAVQATRSNMERIQIAMEGKPLEIRARQEGQRHQTAVEGSGNEAAVTNYVCTESQIEIVMATVTQLRASILRCLVTSIYFCSLEKNQCNTRLYMAN
jgi:hypothetical protein